MKEFDFPNVLEGCTCGGTHKCSVQNVVIANGALQSIPGLLAGYNNVLLVYDNNTWHACAKQVAALLQNSNFTVSAMHYDTNDILVPDEDAINAFFHAAGKEVKAMIGIGAGVINDLCKWVSYQLRIPYMIVATAPSMDGFASDGAALIIKGMKVTYKAQVPRWIVADTSVLQKAPMHLLRSGAGDILGKISSLNDWKLSQIINDETLCPEIYNIVQQQVDTCLADLPLINRRDERAVERLMRSLVTVGFCMSYIGNSRPASGSEHHLAHFFEVTSVLYKRPYLSHGVDVLYGTAVTCALRHMLSQRKDEAVYEPLRSEYWHEKREAVYGPLTPEAEALQAKLGLFGDVRAQRQIQIRNQWPRLQKVLEDVPQEQEIIKHIGELGLDFPEFLATYSRDSICNAILFAKELKDRYTLLWLMQDMGLLEELAEAYCKTLT